MTTRAAPRHSPSSMGVGLWLLFLLSCGGSTAPSGDRAGQVNGPFRISPALAAVATGQTRQFIATSPWGGGASWTVVPASAGTCDANGTFTASSLLGPCQLVAIWNQDVRYTAIAQVEVVTPPPPAVLNPSLVQASGRSQASVGGSIRNAPVAGESLPATPSANATGTVQVRHGFDPPAH